MFLSVFDIFKIGIGPSSSHTMGPMVAAGRFLDELRRVLERGARPDRLHVTARLYGSLAFTGHGHGSDRAVMLGLLGYLPDSLDPDLAEGYVAELMQRGEIVLPGLPPLSFAPDRDLVFDYGPPLPAHPNGMVIAAQAPDGAT
ncbi:L-serine ammonia-lyase, partial [Escherichia coli]|nr:L-serine ammonia-lyase [Escherichia coli]